MLVTIPSSHALKQIFLKKIQTMQLFCRFYTSFFLIIYLSALHCTLFPFVSSSWVHMMLWCQASSRAAAEPNRRERGRRGEGKWQTRAGGILGAAKNSTQKRRGERWRVCRHGDKRNTGWIIFRWFNNEMFFCQWRRAVTAKRKVPQNKQWLVLI